MRSDMANMEVNFTCSTAGDGLWSNVAGRAVTCIGLSCDAMMYREDVDGTQEWGELRVYFDTKTWNVREDGLIYTDDGFEAQLRARLAELGFNEAACADVDYSEQGMQGDDYVSLDIGHKFLSEFRRISGQAVEPDLV